MKTVYSVCGMCGTRCPVAVGVENGEAVWIQGNPHSATGSTLCPRGIAALALPIHSHTAAIAAFVVMGIGCAPIYPCIIHSTPAHFGADRSQAIIGVQMACAYVGTCLMPPLFGLLAQHISVSLLPAYLLVLLVLMAVMHESLIRKIAKTKQAA